MLTFTIGAEQNILQEEFNYNHSTEEEFTQSSAAFYNTTVANSTQDPDAGDGSVLVCYDGLNTTTHNCTDDYHTANYTGPYVEAPEPVKWGFFDYVFGASCEIGSDECPHANFTFQVSDDEFNTVKDSIEVAETGVSAAELAISDQNIGPVDLSNLSRGQYFRVLIEIDMGQDSLGNDDTSSTTVKYGIRSYSANGTFQTSEGNMNSGEGLVSVLPFIFGALLIGFLFKVMF